jgi:hypothetical protein
MLCNFCPANGWLRVADVGSIILAFSSACTGHGGRCFPALGFLCCHVAKHLNLQLLDALPYTKYAAAAAHCCDCV